ncbi:unnamed protein product [Schistosoma margrebowiei]|uniref:Uncharacterized protein n=1 Tax=Schistosoma margrebowiei TaxID=48269 RepID=A0A183N293_9TREM|nr:unnamed protein product [Schistosoma margrebowiei]
MVVDGSQQEIGDLDFMLLDTNQYGVPVILSLVIIWNILSTKDTSSSTPVRYIIHPQGAVFVAGVLLEALNELTRAFPSHFYPSEVCQSESAGTSHSTDIAFTSFWDIFNRFSQSNITPLSVGSTTRPVLRRARISSRKRPVSISDKHQAIDSTQESSSSVRFESGSLCDCIPLNGVCTKTIFAPCCNNTVCKLSGPFSGRCKSEGQNCTKTIFSPCCANSTCQLHGLFKGVCVKCLPEKHLCLSSNECCTKLCSWFRCIMTN